MKNIRSHTLDRDPIYLPRPQNASPNAPRSAYAAFELQGLAGLSPKARISRQVLLAARSSKLMMASMGEDGAFELRYIVTPSREANEWQSSIRAFLLMRVSRWHTPPAALRRRAQQLADELEQLLESTLPEYHFQPVTDSATVKKALTPFIIRDTLEVRRRYLDGFARQPLPLPWQGAIDVESVLDVMLRQEGQRRFLCASRRHTSMIRGMRGRWSPRTSPPPRTPDRSRCSAIRWRLMARPRSICASGSSRCMYAARSR